MRIDFPSLVGAWRSNVCFGFFVYCLLIWKNYSSLPHAAHVPHTSLFHHQTSDGTMQFCVYHTNHLVEDVRKENNDENAQLVTSRRHFFSRCCWCWLRTAFRRWLLPKSFGGIIDFMRRSMELPRRPSGNFSGGDGEDAERSNNALGVQHIRLNIHRRMTRIMNFILATNWWIM